MPSSILRVLLASYGFTQTSTTLQSLCASTGRILDLFLVSVRENLPAALLKFQPDIAFIELPLLQPETSRALRSLHHASPKIPLILIASPADKDLVAKYLKAGAKDYMLEGHIDERTLGRVLHAALGSTPLTPCCGHPRAIRSRYWSIVRVCSLNRLILHPAPLSLAINILSPFCSTTCRKCAPLPVPSPSFRASGSQRHFAVVPPPF